MRIASTRVPGSRRCHGQGETRNGNVAGLVSELAVATVAVLVSELPVATVAGLS